MFLNTSYCIEIKIQKLITRDFRPSSLNNLTPYEIIIIDHKIIIGYGKRIKQ